MITYRKKLILTRPSFHVSEVAYVTGEFLEYFRGRNDYPNKNKKTFIHVMSPVVHLLVVGRVVENKVNTEE